MSLRAILTDFDGVLRRWDPAPARAAEAAAGLTPGALAAAAFAPELLLPAIRGEVEDATWRARIAERLAERVGPERARAAVAAWSESCGELDPEVHELLARARPACTLVLVTNATTRLPSDLARPGWLDLAAPGALAGSIWPRMARSACSWHPCWVDLAALCGPGRPTGSIWLPNECPIDTISQKKIDLLIDDHASMLPASCALTRFFMPQTQFVT